MGRTSIAQHINICPQKNILSYSYSSWIQHVTCLIKLIELKNIVAVIDYKENPDTPHTMTTGTPPPIAEPNPTMSPPITNNAVVICCSGSIIIGNKYT
jgi:hypothetical protein